METPRDTRHGSPARSSKVRPIAIIAATIAMLVALVPAAQADAAGFEEVEFPEGGFFYGDFDAELLLFSGSSAEDYCNGYDPSLAARLFENNDGSITFKVDGSEQPLYLYSSPLGAPEFIDATCSALAAGDQIVEPFATGDGTVRMRFTIESDGTAHMVNSSIGAATAADGTTWRVRGWADLMIVDGVPVGSPVDFQGLRVARTGA